MAFVTYPLFVVRPRAALSERLETHYPVGSNSHKAWFTEASVWRHPYVGDHDYEGQAADGLSWFKLEFLASLYEEGALIQEETLESLLPTVDETMRTFKEQQAEGFKVALAAWGMLVSDPPLTEDFFDRYWEILPPVFSQRRLSLRSLSVDSLAAVEAEDPSRTTGNHVSKSFVDEWQRVIHDAAQLHQRNHEFCLDAIRALCAEFKSKSSWLQLPPARGGVSLVALERDLRHDGLTFDRASLLALHLVYGGATHDDIEMHFTLSEAAGTRRIPARMGWPEWSYPKTKGVCRGRFVSPPWDDPPIRGRIEWEKWGVTFVEGDRTDPGRST